MPKHIKTKEKHNKHNKHNKHQKSKKDDNEDLSDFENEPIYDKDYMPNDDDDNNNLDYDPDVDNEFDKLENMEDLDYDPDEIIQDDEHDIDNAEEVEKDDNMSISDDNELISHKILITKDRLMVIMDNVKKNKSIQGLRLFLRLFRSAVIVGEDIDDEKKPSKYEYEIEDGSVFNKIIHFALEDIPNIFIEILKKNHQQTEDNIDGIDDEIGNKRTFQVLLNGYFSNYIKFMMKPHDKNIYVFILNNSTKILKLIKKVKNYYRKLIKILLDLWSTNESNLVKFKAYVNIRQICILCKPEEIEPMFKKIYLNFVKNAKHVAWNNYEQINFMINCYVELMGINQDAAYVVGFGCIRDIAIHLKNCIQERSKEKISKIYNWQYINSIRLWLKVISSYHNEGSLKKLAYPLIEIIIGIIRYYPNIKYSPLQLNLIGYMNEFSDKTGIYIPTICYMTEILANTDFNKKRQTKTNKAFDFLIRLKVQKEYMNSEIFYRDLFKNIINKIMESMSNIADSIAFPESLIYLRIILKKQIKELKYKGYKTDLKMLLGLLDENAKLVFEKRHDINLEDQNKYSNLRDYIKGIVKQLPIKKIHKQFKKQTENMIKQNVLAEQNQFDKGDNKLDIENIEE